MLFPAWCFYASDAFALQSMRGAKLSAMILIEPAIEEKFGRAALKKRGIGGFLSRAMKAAKLAGGVSVLLTGDEEIRQLNRVFRHKDKTTDVLSFPAMQMNVNRKLAGDLAISVETAARAAEQREHGLDVELKILMLHGVLHLAGWDHERDSGDMARKEEQLRKRLGLEEGLIGRTAKLRTQRTASAIPTLSGKTRKDGAPGSVADKGSGARKSRAGAPAAVAGKTPRGRAKR